MSFFSKGPAVLPLAEFSLYVKKGLTPKRSAAPGHCTRSASTEEVELGVGFRVERKWSPGRCANDGRRCKAPDVGVGRGLGDTRLVDGARTLGDDLHLLLQRRQSCPYTCDHYDHISIDKLDSSIRSSLLFSTSFLSSASTPLPEPSSTSAVFGACDGFF